MARVFKAQDVQRSGVAAESVSDPSVLGPCAFLLINPEGRLVSFNPDLLTLGLVPINSILPLPISALPSGLTSLLERSQAAGLPLTRQPWVWCRPDQSDIAFLVDVLLFPNPAPALPALSVLIRPCPAGHGVDATAPPLLANASSLLAGMAHEIKNSLVAVKTLVGLLLERDPNLEMAQIVRHEVDRISAIVSQMLRFAGPSQGDFEWVRVHPVLEMTLQLVRPQLRLHSIEIHSELASGDDEIWGDRYQIEQAFLNLILNAMEAMSDGGTLSVSTAFREDSSPPETSSPERPARKILMVTVKDTGCGIPAENMGRLFEDFFTTKSEGTGLGLPITRRIMTAHRGTIEVTSEVGQGTCFVISFPLRQGSSPVPFDAFR